MNQTLVDNWNAVVAPDDEVFLLGDIAMKTTQAEIWIPKLKGNITLIAGNHDFTPYKNPKRRECYEKLGFKEIDYEKMIEIDGVSVKLHHMPYVSNNDEAYYDDRYRDLRPIPTGEKILLCGHVHERWRIKNNMINVGVDVNNYAPLSEDSVSAMIKSINLSSP
jgi:calcineurin-like phosphoesterase family protein